MNYRVNDLIKDWLACEAPMTDLLHNAHNEPITWRQDGAREYAPANHGLPVREESITQIGRGESLTDSTLISIGDATLFRVRIYVRSVGVTVLNPEFVAFAMPVSWCEGQTINGESPRSTRIYMPAESLYIRGDSRETLGVVLRRGRFIETVAALRGIAPEDVRLADQSVELTPAAAENLHRQLNARLDKSPNSDGQQDLENALFGLMADAYLYARPEFASNASRVHQPRRIVRKAEECFMAAEGRPVSLADLCAAAGVSKSTLYLAFHNLCGESPLAYFQKRRFMRARSALLNAAPERGAIKRAALDAGLTELGRFSVEYKHLFGEAPSVTLNKSPY